jgi:CMP-2-keto-3-deoxyoctulosonic acid synthetase
MGRCPRRDEASLRHVDQFFLATDNETVLTSVTRQDVQTVLTSVTRQDVQRDLVRNAL